MKQLSEASTTHSQYAAAMENLKHIFNITDTTDRTKQALQENRLLVAHKNIMELETARDDLMLVLHNLRSERRDYDKNLLKKYFDDVERLVQELGKQLKYICSRALNAPTGNDSTGIQQLVTALRIIEREERWEEIFCYGGVECI